MLEYKHLLSNNLSSYACNGIIGKEIADVGAEEGMDVLGAGVGRDYDITENVSVFANTDILTAKGHGNAKANIDFDILSRY